MNNEYRDYIGEYFMAVLTGKSPRRSWHILQIDPVVYLAETTDYAMAVELVNRLDVTGESPIGEDIDECTSEE
jgi:hypothetical protein